MQLEITIIFTKLVMSDFIYLFIYLKFQKEIPSNFVDLLTIRMGKFFGGKKKPCFSIINSMTNFVKKIWENFGEFFKYTKKLG
jgi:hypothetical protein